MIMVTTGGRNDAERLGEGLVVEHLAGCCTVIPMVHSFYYWDGQLKREHESLLLVKTIESRAQAVQELRPQNHPLRAAEDNPVAHHQCLAEVLRLVRKQGPRPES